MMKKKTQDNYVDGFVLSVPRRNLAAYKKMSRLMGKVMMNNGALTYREAYLDDKKVMMGMPFPKMSKPRAGEVVVFAWITFKSKAHRNAVNRKMMKDPLCGSMGNMKMPFDPKRMAYGGFKIFVKGD